MVQQSEISNIYYSEKAFEQFNNYLEIKNISSIFVLVDENTHEKCLPFFLQNLPALKNYELLEVEPGEESKSPEILVQLWQVLSDFNASRHDLIVNLGGGVITDLGGFLAATYMRGISFINFPTTLLAMADASAGGKTGINLGGYKNRVGAFAEAEMIGIVPGFLDTLPRKEVLSGLAEMLKHGLIADASHFWELSELNPEHPQVQEHLLRHSIEIKRDITHRDPKETGERKILNFGHTVGHALESHSHESRNPLSHGHAVALGMLAELELSVQYTGLAAAEADEARKVLMKFYDKPGPGMEAERLLKLMRGDKKNRQGEIRFSLLEKTGAAVYDIAVPEHEVLKILQKPELFGKD